MKEKDIEKVLVSEVRKAGGRAYKWASPGNAGVPDRIVIFPGRAPVFVELKADGGSLTRLQKAQIEKLEDLGQAVYVAKGMEGVSGFFQAMGYKEISRALDCKYGL